MSSFRIYNNKLTLNEVFTALYKHGYLIVPSSDTPPIVSTSGNIYYNTSIGRLEVSTGVNSWSSLGDGTLGQALTSIQNLTTSENEMLYTIGPNTYATAPITNLGRTLVASTNQTTSQSAIGTVIGVDVQPQSSALTSFDALSASSSNNKLIYSTGNNTFGIIDLSSFARTLLGDTTDVDMRATLGFSTTFVPDGDIVGTTDSQTLTNKTITNTSNQIRSTSIGDVSGTFTNTIQTGGGTPSIGQTIVSLGDGTATWQTIPGDVKGPGSSTPNEIVRYDGPTGKIIKNGTTVTLSDMNNITGVNNLTAVSVSANIIQADQTQITSVGTLGLLNVTNNITVGGTVDTVKVSNLAPLTATASELGDLTTPEIQQLQNINLTTISPSQWGYIGNMNQDISTTGNPTFTSGTFTSSLNINGGAVVPNTQSITLSDAPIVGTDAANKSYVDLVGGTGLKPLSPADLATTTVLPNSPTYLSEVLTATTNGVLIIDSITVTGSERILVKNQSDNKQNGVYDVTATGDVSNPWILTRSSDFNSTSDPISQNTYIFVINGSTLIGSSWIVSPEITTIDTNPVIFVLFSSSPATEAGNGLTKIGNTLNVGQGTGITVNGNDIQISNTYPGQVSINTVGSITTGTWNGDTIDIEHGGTNATSTINARNNLGLEIGTDVQQWDQALDSISGLITSSDNLIYTTGLDAYATSTLTPFARTLLDDTTAINMRTTLGFGTLPIGDLVGTTDSQTLTNKELVDVTTIFQNVIDSNKKSGLTQQTSLQDKPES